MLVLYSDMERREQGWVCRLLSGAGERLGDANKIIPNIDKRSRCQEKVSSRVCVCVIERVCPTCQRAERLSPC